MTDAKVLVTGSAGRLGEVLTRVLRGRSYQVTGLDLRASSGTDAAGSITDRGLVRGCLDGAQAVLHAATLHKPQIGFGRYIVSATTSFAAADATRAARWPVPWAPRVTTMNRRAFTPPC